MADAPQRILRASGKVERITTHMSVAEFARELGADCFRVSPLPHLGDSPRMVAISDEDAALKGRPENAAATAVYRKSYPAGQALHGDVAVVLDGSFGGFIHG